MEHDPIVDEFTHQSAAFNRSPVMRSADTLGRLIDALPCSPGERWLEAACGPGLVARALAPSVASVHGVDLTPAMIELAQRETAREGIGNVTFSIGDVTRLEFDDASFDGAVTRFSLHHIPRPIRVLHELARVVRPGGPVVVADHLTSADGEVAAWHQEIERLRDPSHWACLSSDRLAGLSAQAGLELERFDEYPFSLDYEEWLERGSGGPSARTLIAQSVAEHEPGPPFFNVTADGQLHLVYGLAVWRRGPTPTSGRLIA